ESLKGVETIDVEVKELRRSPCFEIDNDKDETLSMSFEETHMPDIEKISNVEMETQSQGTQVVDIVPSVEQEKDVQIDMQEMLVLGATLVIGPQSTNEGGMSESENIPIAIIIEAKTIEFITTPSVQDGNVVMPNTQ
ncbi:hypothetical protein KI387_024376, partial [Taxus chinensis]